MGPFRLPWAANIARRFSCPNRRFFAVAAAQPVQSYPLPDNPSQVPLVPGGGVSHWKTTDAVPLNRQSVLDLLYGKTPLIKHPGFLTPDECWKYEEAFSRKLTPYTHNTGPLLQRVGIAQFEYQAQTQEDFHTRTNEQEIYFQEAKKWLRFHDELKAQGLDAWHRVFNVMASLFPDWDLEIASEGPDRKYFSGIFRALNDSTHLHCDFSPYDSLTEDWIINSVQCQIVFNLYLAPVKGGRTIVHDAQWTTDSLRYRDPGSYGYDRQLVDGTKKAYCEPSLGALCMFNSRNMHEVEEVDVEEMPELGLPYRPRLTLSSFMGLLPSSKTGGNPKLIFWS